MRNVKFRAWNKVTKTMYTDAINNCKDSFDMILKHPQIYEVMQYTGLKDKSGVEIYEGDILRWKCSKSGSNKIKQYITTITWDNGRYELEIYDNKEKWATGESFWNDKDREVIGNIYENPELLKEV